MSAWGIELVAARTTWETQGLLSNCQTTQFLYKSPAADIEYVHCHVIKNKIKTMQWIKSRNCDIIDDK